MSHIDEMVRRYFPAQPTQSQGDYDVVDNLIYQGFAKVGVATSALGWLIVKHVYDGSNRWTGSRVYENGAWDSRASYFT